MDCSEIRLGLPNRVFKFNVCTAIALEQLAAPSLNVLPDCAFPALEAMILLKLLENGCGIAAILSGQ